MLTQRPQKPQRPSSGNPTAAKAAMSETVPSDNPNLVQQDSPKVDLAIGEEKIATKKSVAVFTEEEKRVLRPEPRVQER